MRRALAALTWGLPVIWAAADPADEPQAVTAEAVHVHYHVHLPPGASPAEAEALAARLYLEAGADEVSRTDVRNPPLADP
jgi:hypothetical protein